MAGGIFPKRGGCWDGNLRSPLKRGFADLCQWLKDLPDESLEEAVTAYESADESQRLAP